MDCRGGPFNYTPHCRPFSHPCPSQLAPARFRHSHVPPHHPVSLPCPSQPTPAYSHNSHLPSHHPPSLPHPSQLTPGAWNPGLAPAPSTTVALVPAMHRAITALTRATSLSGMRTPAIVPRLGTRTTSPRPLAAAVALPPTPFAVGLTPALELAPSLRRVKLRVATRAGPAPSERREGCLRREGASGGVLGVGQEMAAVRVVGRGDGWVESRGSESGSLAN